MLYFTGFSIGCLHKTPFATGVSVCWEFKAHVTNFQASFTYLRSSACKLLLTNMQFGHVAHPNVVSHPNEEFTFAILHAYNGGAK